MSDINCPICMDIFIEPVVLPCEHCLCKPCFAENVKLASLQCPLCRKRIGTWARHNGRKGTLVDEAKWRYIRETYPDLVEARLKGKTPPPSADFTGSYARMVQLSKTGEIRKEYERELAKIQKEQQEQLKASEKLAQELLLLEQQQYEELRRQEERDAAYAQKIAFRKADKENKPLGKGKRVTQHLARSDSIDSIGPEFNRHFKPIVRYPRTPPNTRKGEGYPETIKVTPCSKTMKCLNFSTSPQCNKSAAVAPSQTVQSAISPHHIMLPLHPSLGSDELSQLSNSSENTFSAGLIGTMTPVPSATLKKRSRLDRVTSSTQSALDNESPDNDSDSRILSHTERVCSKLHAKNSSINSIVCTGTKRARVNGIHRPDSSSSQARNCVKRSRRSSSVTMSSKKVHGLRSSARAVSATECSQDRLSMQSIQSDEEIAKKLQKRFNLEHMYKLNASRYVGGEDEYFFRKREHPAVYNLTKLSKTS